jgi:multicomponent Na+:H+ antiporter subunit A
MALVKENLPTTEPVHHDRSGLTGWLLALIPLAIFGWLLSLQPAIATGQTIQGQWAWAPSLGISFSYGIDGLSLLFGLLISGIGALVFVYAGGYLAGDRELNRFYAYLLLFMGAMLGVVFSRNLLMLFIFWELTSITSYLLIGYKHAYADSRAAALQALLVTGGGGLAMLVGILLLGQVGGSLEIECAGGP